MILTLDTKNEGSDTLEALLKIYANKARVCAHLAAGVPSEFEAGLNKQSEQYAAIADGIRAELDARAKDFADRQARVRAIIAKRRAESSIAV